MTTIKHLLLALLALAAACAPDVPRTALSDAGVVTAAFDPISGNIPLPNDLALQPRSPGLPPLPAAQEELLNMFRQQQGFPNDQELPVTITLVRSRPASDGGVISEAPTFDPASVNAGNLAVFVTDGGTPALVATDPVRDSDYVPRSNGGVLSIHNRNRVPWPPGQYILGLRGGPNGPKTKEGDPIFAGSTFYLIAQGQTLETEQNLTLLQAQTGSREAAIAAAKQLDAIIGKYKQGAFQLIDQVFPHTELAAMTTFPIAPNPKTVVVVDSTRGIVPLPIDLLRDARAPSASCAQCGKISPQAACVFARGTFNAATGACTDAQGNPNPGAAGFQALDGFSTTGMILATTSDLIQAGTVTSSTVELWDLTTPAAPQKVDPTTLIVEPGEIVQSGFSPAVALQPAGATATDPSSVFRTRPLKDNTDYAVVVTDGVKDKTGAAIAPSTVARILRFTNPLVDSNGKSQLVGIDDGTALALETMKQKIKPVLAQPRTGTATIAYTFHTQTILSTALQLGALPYTKLATTGNTGAVASLTPTAAFAKYGVDPAVPKTNIAEVIETTIITFNLLDPATGAFNPAATTLGESINVLIARPASTNTNVPACAGALAPFGKCSPLVVFRHGLAGGRAAMLTVADTLNAQGFTVVAIDAAKHGERSFCTSGQTQISLGGTLVNQCAAGGACTALLPAGAQGDTNPIGTCAPAAFNYLPVSQSCLVNPASCSWTGTAGVPAVSSNYLVTANFFRTRDTLRQDIIDESQLVRAVAFVPAGAAPTGHNLFDYMVNPTRGVIVDPGKIYFVGQSLGAIQGAVDVATNPRISKAVLNVGGGTVVDVFTTSPAFKSTTDALLASLGITAGANQGYLQFLVVAKTVLDPADPVNFASHIQANTLPDLLTNPNGSVAQQPKALLTQAAFCDQVIPNPWNYVLDSTAGTGPLPPTGAPGTFELFYKSTTAPTQADLSACPAPTSGLSPPATAVSHSFLTSWGAGNSTTLGQQRAASFLAGTPSPSSVVLVQ